MQIVFRFEHPNEVVVSCVGGEVFLSRQTSPYFTGPPISSVGPSPQDLEDSARIRADCDSNELHNRFTMKLNKGQARSIASALMQAAAEV